MTRLIAIGALLGLLLAAAAPALRAQSQAGGAESLIHCLTTVDGRNVFTCRVSPSGPGTTYALSNAPTGMAVQARSGYLRWTPAPQQNGSHTVDILRTSNGVTRHDPYTFVVTAPLAAPAGLYVSPVGRDNGSGSIDDPLLTLHKAADRATPGTTIYLRGGRYRNEGYGTDFGTRPRDSIARITNSGTEQAWITIRPHGNEYVTLESDVNGLVFNNAKFWRLQRLELEGSAQRLDRDISLSLWWDTSAQSDRIDGRGIAMNTSFNIDIGDCVIHDFSGAGVSNNGGSYITLHDSVVYNNGWWTTAGTHGFANSKPATTDNGNTSAFKITMRDNLLFGNQSSMVSHVFSKLYVKLEVDEGNGLHMQNTEEDFVGRFLIERNLSIYNGKAGTGLNTVDHGVIRNNSFYKNAQAVEDAAELTLQTSVSDAIVQNLFHALPQRRTIKDSIGTFPGVGANAAVPSANSAELPASVLRLAAVFRDPDNGDFRPAAGVPDGYGVPNATLTLFAVKRDEYGLTPAAAPTAITPAYMDVVKDAIFKSWPAPTTANGIPPNLKLEDPETGYCYRYEDRNDYPGPSGTPCGNNDTRKRERTRPRSTDDPLADVADVAPPIEAPIDAPVVRAPAIDLAQMSDNTPGTTGAACLQPGVSAAPVSWWRRFYFDEHPGVGAAARAVRVTLATGAQTTAGTSLRVNLYTAPHADAADTIVRMNLTPIGTATATAGASLTSVVVPVNGVIGDTLARDLVVEISYAGSAGGTPLYPGANATAETHPTFVWAPDCGVPEPLPAAMLGFPDFHVGLVVRVDDPDRIFASGFEP